MRPSIRLLIALLAGTALAALLLSRPLRLLPRHSAEPPVLARVRTQLGLRPVLAAEEALRRRPNDPQARLRLASACAGSGDPVGAAMALFPVKENPRLLAEYARYCLQVGWLDEAEAALQRLPSPPARVRLDLAAAFAGHGQAQRAGAVLQALGREELGSDEWLDGAITWYHCRRLDQAVQWARKAVASRQSPVVSEDRPENRVREGSGPIPGAPDAGIAARAVLARCLLASGQPEAALQAIPDHLIIHPLRGYPSSHHLIIRYWRARAEVRCADAALRKSGRERLARVAAESGDAAAAFEVGRAFVLAGEPGRAVALLSRAAVSGYQEVLCYALLSRAYETLGRPAEALWARGRGQADRGQFKEAATALRRSVDLDPSQPMAYVDLARALEADGRPREALDVLGWAQQVVPGSMDVSLLRAKLLLHLERVPEVIRELTAAAALDPKRANEPLGNLGTVYYDSQQFDRAVPVLERAVQLEDGDAHSHFYLGSTYARQLEEPGRAEKAVEHLLRAARMQPDFSRPWMAAAAVLQRMGALPEAAACLRRAIGGECQSDAPYVRLAQLLQLQGRLPERQLVLKQYAAVRDHDLTRTGLEKETRDNPRDAVRRYALGDLLLGEGRPEKALPELLAAAGMRPGWKQAPARLADACALLGYDDLRAEAERGAAREAAKK